MRLLNLKPLTLSLVATLALGAVACSVEPTDLREKLIEKGSRSAAVTGMLDEITSIEVNIDHLKLAASENGKFEDTKMVHVQTLLSSVRPQGEAIEAKLEKLDEANEHVKEAQDEWISAKKANDLLKQEEHDQTPKKQKELIELYRSTAKELVSSYEALLKTTVANYVPTMVKAYNQGECKRIDLIEGLRRLGKDFKDEDYCKSNPEAQMKHCTITDVFVDMIDTDIQRPPRAALIAANTLEAWAVTDAKRISEYINFIKDEKKDFELRDALIRIVTRFADASHKEFLLTLLNKEPDFQPITYNGYAADALGKLKANEAIDRLIECLWLDDARGRNATPSCRLALNRLDPKLVYPALVKTLKRQNEKVEARALRYNYAHTGLVDAKAAEILGDLGNPQVADLLIKALLREDVLPEAFGKEPETATFFTKGQVQKTVSISRALAILGAKDAVKPLLEILKNKDKLFEYKLSAVQQLAYLGDDSANAELLALFSKALKKEEVGDQDMKVQYAKSLVVLLRGGDKALAPFKKGVEESLTQATTWYDEAKKKIEEGEQGQKTQEANKKTAQEEIKKLREAGHRPDRKALDAYDKALSEFNKAKEASAKDKTIVVPAEPTKPTITAEQQKVLDLEASVEKLNDSISQIKGLILEINREQRIYETWKSSYTEIKRQITILEQNGNETAKWAKTLSEGGLPERIMAAYVLSRKNQNSVEAGNALIAHAADKDDVLRDVVLFGLSRHASKDQLAQLKEIRNKQDLESKKNPQAASLSATVYSLDLLIAHIEAM